MERDKTGYKRDKEQEKDKGRAGALSLLWSAWQYEGWHQSAEDGQRWERKGLEAIWNNRKRERERNIGQGVRERGREEETLKQRKEWGKAEAERESDRQWNMLKHHVTSVQTHKQSHTHTQHKLWKCFVRCCVRIYNLSKGIFGYF